MTTWSYVYRRMQIACKNNLNKENVKHFSHKLCPKLGRKVWSIAIFFYSTHLCDFRLMASFFCLVKALRWPGVKFAVIAHLPSNHRLNFDLSPFTPMSYFFIPPPSLRPRCCPKKTTINGCYLHTKWTAFIQQVLKCLFLCYFLIKEIYYIFRNVHDDHHRRSLSHEIQHSLSYADETEESKNSKWMKYAPNSFLKFRCDEWQQN